MITEQAEPRPAQTSIGRARMALIAGIVLAAIGVGLVVGNVLISGGSAGLGGAARYVPADAVMYFEANLDLPGAQRDNLRAILDRFPAVDADDLLTDALADTFDEALAEGDAPFDYSNDVAPWFDGGVAVALLDYPLNIDPAMGQPELPSTVGLFGVRDADAAVAFTDELRGEVEAQGSSFTSSEHGGVTIWSIQPEPDAFMPMQGLGFAYALTDDQLIIASSTESIEAALDASSGESLDERDDVARLVSALPDERVGTSVVDSAAMLAEMRAELESAQPAMLEAFSGYLDAMPPLSVGAVSFADEAVLFDGVSERPGAPFDGDNRSRELAAMVPADALFFADAESIGPILEEMVTSFKSAAAAADAEVDLDQFEAALGADLEEFVSWIGGGGMVAGWDGEEIYVGLVLEATDPDAAAQRLQQLRALAQLGGEAGVTVSTQTVAGVEVTTLTMADATMGEMPVAPALQYAVAGDRVFIGLGDRFVGRALSLDVDDSLARTDRFEAAVSRFGGDENVSTFYVDLAGVREAVESAVGASEMPGYAEVRPNMEPFDYLAGVTRVEGDRQVSRMGLVLR